MPDFWTTRETAFVSVVVVALIITVVIIFYLYRNRHVQPLKKVSPLLLLISVIGNFLVIFNITGVFLFFDSFAVA